VLDDAALIARTLASDDRHAFATLVRRHQAMVRALLRRLSCGDHALADDLAQETFLRAYGGLAGFRSDARFSSWLYRIAYNVFLSRAPKTLILEAPPDAFTPAYDGGDLNRALRTLRDIERALVTLSCVEEYTHEELAELFELPLGTVKSHIQRGKQKLKAALSEERHV
jgi:RNA polymerase sigma-70 factor (ECF subfamily)